MSALKRMARRAIAAMAVPAGMTAACVIGPIARATPTAPVTRTAPGSSGVAIRSAASRGLARLTATRHWEPRRLRAYAWAVTQAGHPYVWGGTGPGYDCSGLVMMAYRHVGLYLPRTTYEMLASPMLVRVWQPRMGDLAFYGSGHVELFRRWGYTFGARSYAWPVGLIHYGGGWRPTSFYRVR